MNRQIMQTEYNNIKSIIKDLETKRDELGNDLVDAKILKLKERIKQIEIQTLCFLLPPGVP